MEVRSDVKAGTTHTVDADVDFGAGDPKSRALVQQWVEELDGMTELGNDHDVMMVKAPRKTGV